MSPKPSKFTPVTKLSDMSPEKLENNNSSNFSILKKKKKINPVSFRLREIDIERFDNILNKANSSNDSHPFNRANLLRGLIMMALDQDDKEIAKYIRNSL